jgi:hypothetical protein
MRFFVPILIVILVFALIGCSQNNKNISVETKLSSDISELISSMEKKGYYRYIDSSQVSKVKNESLDAGYIFGWEESGRDFSSDAESLAEGGIPDFYNDIRDFLRKQNVEINVKNESFSSKGYTLNVNGSTYKIYDENEMESKNIWELSTVRGFAIINKLLKDAGSDEQLYMLYGGNDLRAVFLTEEMYQLIVGYNSITSEELLIKVDEHILK